MRLGTAASLFSVGRVVADFVCDVIRVVITVVSCRRHCCSQCRVGAAVDVVNILNIFSTFFLLLLMGSQHFVSALLSTACRWTDRLGVTLALDSASTTHTDIFTRMAAGEPGTETDRQKGYAKRWQ